MSTQDQVEIEQAAKVRGYSSPSAFIRAAIRNELHGHEEMTEEEDIRQAPAYAAWRVEEFEVPLPTE